MFNEIGEPMFENETTLTACADREPPNATRLMPGAVPLTTSDAVLLEWDDEGPGYAVSVPALRGCFTQGATVDEALESAREAIAGHIAALTELGEEIPTEDKPALLTVVHVDQLQPS